MPALQADQRTLPPSAATSRLIRRTKEYLETRSTRRLRLADIAAAVGATPSYLTAVFTRFEGVSLQRYITRLRLTRALVDLHRVDDITELALSLGFSSHSHFTLAFRRMFGCTPSAFRSATRRERRDRSPMAGILA